MGIDWIRKNEEKNEIQFSLRNLLARVGLNVEQSKLTMEVAVRWIERFHLEFNSGFIFPIYFERDDINLDSFRVTTRCAMRWLEKYSDTEDFGFVFRHLIKREELQTSDRNELARLAIRHLKSPRIRNTPGASYPLKILEYVDIEQDAMDEIISLGHEWLRHNNSDTADFVVNRLLFLNCVPDEIRRDALDVGFGWFAEKRETEAAVHACFNFVRRPRLLTPEEISKIVNFVLESKRVSYSLLRLALRMEEVTKGTPLNSEMRRFIKKRGWSSMVGVKQV